MRRPSWPRVRALVIERDGDVCGICGGCVPESEVEIDHIHPRKAGGGHDPANLRVTHRRCNRRKAGADRRQPRGALPEGDRIPLTLRPDPALSKALEEMAERELRSVSAQAAYLIRQGLERAREEQSK